MHGYASRKGTCRVGRNRDKIDMLVGCALRGTYQFCPGSDQEQRPPRCEAGEEQNEVRPPPRQRCAAAQTHPLSCSSRFSKRQNESSMLVSFRATELGTPPSSVAASSLRWRFTPRVCSSLIAREIRGVTSSCVDRLYWCFQVKLVRVVRRRAPRRAPATRSNMRRGDATEMHFDGAQHAWTLKVERPTRHHTPHATRGLLSGSVAEHNISAAPRRSRTPVARARSVYPHQ